MRAHGRFLAVALLVLGAACDKAPKKDEAKGQPAAPTKPEGAQAPSLPTPVVKLLDPGAEPRVQLRLHPQAGAKENLVLSMKMAMEMTMPGMAQPPIKLPEMKIGMDMTVTSVTPDGDIAYEFVLSQTDVVDDGTSPAMVVSAMKGAMEGAKGLAGKGTMTNRGFNKGTEVKVPDGAKPELKQIITGMKDSFNQIAAPLPDEPVGKGARWQVTMTLNTGGMSIDQTATYELLELNGDVAHAKSTVAQTAKPQKVKNDQLAGMDATLERLEAKGSGEVTFDLGKVVPPLATGTIHSEVEMSMAMGNQKQQMSTKMDLEIRAEAK